MRISNLLFAIIATLVLISCDPDYQLNNIRVELKTDSLFIASTLQKVVFKKIGNLTRSNVYGRVNIKNETNNTVYFNLRDFKLFVNNTNKFGEIYFDSPVDYLIRMEELHAHDSIEYDVYWAFDNLLSTEELKFNLKYEPSKTAFLVPF